MPQEKAPSSGALLPASLMYFCSGQLMHFCSGVDTIHEPQYRPFLTPLVKTGRLTYRSAGSASERYTYLIA
jgi:hypothetical protein